LSPDSPIPPEELRVVFGSGDDAVEAEPLGRGVPAATAGVWLVRSGGDAAVLKLVHHDPGRQPTLACRRGSGASVLLAAGGLRLRDSFLESLPAPRCLACVDRADGSVALWLEALAEPPRRIERYGRRAALASGTLDAETEARWRGARPLIERLGEEARELASSE
jgi:hypothetical protein